ncbi:MAG: metallophosphoesterase [Myxococcota bacterium]
MVRPLWIIGDVHASSPDAELFRLLTAAVERQADLLFMGDLFEAWLGPERFWSNAMRPLLETLRQCRRAGLRVTFVQGNRDYLTAGLAGDVFDDVWTKPSLRTIGGQPTWVLHGDGIDARDHAYRTWRTISRGRVANALLRGLPSRWGQRLPTWTAHRLESTNRAFKDGQLPEAALCEVAREARRAGAHRCLLGHFHTGANLDFDGTTVRIVPGWRETRTVVVATADYLRPHKMEDLLAPSPTEVASGT